jgi:hypothetical protein
VAIVMPGGEGAICREKSGSGSFGRVAENLSGQMFWAQVRFFSKPKWAGSIY